MSSSVTQFHANYLLESRFWKSKKHFPWFLEKPSVPIHLLPLPATSPLPPLSVPLSQSLFCLINPRRDEPVVADHTLISFIIWEESSSLFKQSLLSNTSKPHLSLSNRQTKEKMEVNGKQQPVLLLTFDIYLVSFQNDITMPEFGNNNTGWQNYIFMVHF